MNNIIELTNATIHNGHNIEVIKTFADNSVDSIVTDPPYELGFMGKNWDKSGIAYSIELWQECLRVLKPGGHLLAFGGSRTWHRLAVAIEDAGFEIRDSIAWLYGNGFPKSHNISKAIDKTQGANVKIGKAFKVAGEYGNRDLRDPESQGESRDEIRHSAITDEAKKWDGWGTALKPAFEPIVVARKPLIGTVAENVLAYGTGGLNIDASRIGYQNKKDKALAMPGSTPATEIATGKISILSGIRQPHDPKNGRWPANIILDETTAEILDEQSGIKKDGVAVKRNSAGKNIFSETVKPLADDLGYGGIGGASRFFYVAKASKRDRNEGLDNIEGASIGAKGNELTRICEHCGTRFLNPCDCPNRTYINPVRQNFHPTVKPTTLMTYLIKLITPPNGVILDPFAGSGSTGKAALLEGYKFIGIELTEEYIPIIVGRLNHAQQTRDNKETLFDE